MQKIQENILEKLKEKFPHHIPAVFSSFVYLLVALILQGKDKWVIAFLILVFITSIFYHSHPENKFFRFGDWLASISFIVYMINILIGNNSMHFYAVIIMLCIFAVVFWIISEIAYYNKFNKIFNISHTAWHILSAFTVLVVILSI